LLALSPTDWNLDIPFLRQRALSSQRDSNSPLGNIPSEIKFNEM
jgi:hypothetical protein